MFANYPLKITIFSTLSKYQARRYIGDVADELLNNRPHYYREKSTYDRSPYANQSQN